MKFAQAVKLRSTARSPLELLRRMRKLYDDPKAWTTGDWLSASKVYDSWSASGVNEDGGTFDEPEMREALAGNKIPPSADIAFCLDGACVFVNGVYEENARRILKMAICVYDPVYFLSDSEALRLENGDDSMFIYNWNDNRAKNIKNIRAVLDIAINIAKKLAKAQ